MKVHIRTAVQLMNSNEPLGPCGKSTHQIREASPTRARRTLPLRVRASQSATLAPERASILCTVPEAVLPQATEHNIFVLSCVYGAVSVCVVCCGVSAVCVAGPPLRFRGSVWLLFSWSAVFLTSFTFSSFIHSTTDVSDRPSPSPRGQTPSILQNDES